MSNYSALLDANVLYPAPLRDLLVTVAQRGIYRGRWTTSIHDEWIDNLLIKRPDLTREQLERTRELMNNISDDCLVEGYEPLISTLTLPDADDRHVLAAAIVGRCDAIVTNNIKDFPEEVCAPFGIEVIQPDPFLCGQLELQPDAFCQCVRSILGRLKNPPQTLPEYVETLKAQGLEALVELLWSYIDLLEPHRTSITTQGRLS